MWPPILSRKSFKRSLIDNRPTICLSTTPTRKMFGTNLSGRFLPKGHPSSFFTYSGKRLDSSRSNANSKEGFSFLNAAMAFLKDVSSSERKGLNFSLFDFMFHPAAAGGPVLGLPGLPTTKLERVLGRPTLSYKPLRADRLLGALGSAHNKA